jgi:hypothetical protein
MMPTRFGGVASSIVRCGHGEWPAFTKGGRNMTDALGRTLEHRIIILEQRLDNVEKDQNYIFEAMVEWLDNPSEERGFLRTILNKIERDQKP